MQLRTPFHGDGFAGAMYRKASAVDAPYGMPLNVRIPLRENPRILPLAISTILPEFGATTVRAAAGLGAGDAWSAAPDVRESSGAAASVAVDWSQRRRPMSAVGFFVLMSGSSRFSIRQF